MAQTNCLISAGYTLGCKDNTGSIKSVYLGNWSSNTTYAEKTDGTITGTTSGSTVYKFDVVKQTAGLNETINASTENGTVFYQQELALVFNKMSADLRNQILLIAKATTVAIIEDQNGNYWLLGRVNGMDLTTGTAGTGVAYGDRNGYALTLTGMEPELASPIEFAAFSAQIGA